MDVLTTAAVALIPGQAGVVSTVRVLIADDHPQMLAAMVHVVESDGRFTLVGTAANGPDALRLAQEFPVDVALLDVRMPGGGPEAVTAFHAMDPAPAVVAVSAETSMSTVAAMVRAGAVGYLAKGRIGESLPDVLAQCAAGEVVLATGSGAGAMRMLLGA
ncbi:MULTISPECIES: response regulator [unclassified Phycicoccus]|uniref:response regulator n=1 Tax=unclassified Phycicoccus TaxID=2637926 RepID=UPI000702F9EF|nr:MULTISPECIES: response regulator transcription factor [unclassified Phycicoccus]KQU70646.1 hypothetical protein ASC58_02305 [Phycicoccus sp. Root101]KQZ88948.1 hypothetical protein ASD62_06150 [Phycicoccus sp. Root563]